MWMVTLDPSPMVTLAPPVEIWPPTVEGAAMEMFFPARRFCICWTVRMEGIFVGVLVSEAFFLWRRGEVPDTTGMTQFPILTVWVVKLTGGLEEEEEEEEVELRPPLLLLLGLRMVTPCLGLPLASLVGVVKEEEEEVKEREVVVEVEVEEEEEEEEVFRVTCRTLMLFRASAP